MHATFPHSLLGAMMDRASMTRQGGHIGMSNTLLGRVAPGVIRTTDFARPEPALVAAYQALTDLTGPIADAMDLLGLAAATIAATELIPMVPGLRLVGPALTVRNLPARQGIAAAVAAGRSGLGEIEAHNICQCGDVLVIEGVAQCSSLGGMAAEIAQREGEAGAVVDGGVRDIAGARALGFPIFARSVSPLTGKWRVETVEINGPVRIAGVRVDPGDLVCGDENGLVIVPRAAVATVLDLIVTRIAPWEATRTAAIRRGASLAELAGVKQ